MAHENDVQGNTIPDVWDKRIAKIIAAVVAVLVLVSEWCAGGSVAVWCTRAVAALAVISNIFGWGMVVRPGKATQPPTPTTPAQN